MTCEEKIKSEAFGELLIDYTIGENGAIEAMEDYCRVEVDSTISIIYFRQGEGAEVDLRDYPYSALPKCYGLMQLEDENRPEAEDRNRMPGERFDPLALADAGILQVQRPPLSLTGRGVIIGFIDTGVRYTMDVFRTSAGDSRILAIWDQTLEGTPPEGFLYGAEYNRQQINVALSSDSPRAYVPSWDTDGHGTAVASVAAGSILEGGSRYNGAAPDADIVVVKLRGAKRYLRDYYILPEDAAAYAETDIVMAVKYLESFAVERERPVIICMGTGTSYGSHTGDSVLDRYINLVAERRSRVVIVPGGNEGALAHHVQNFSTEEAQNIEIRIGAGERGFILETWSEGPGLYRMTIRTPGGEEITGISTESRKREEYSFIFEDTVITVDSIPVEAASGRSLILIRFVAPTPGIWTLTIAAELGIAGGRYHMWLPIERFMRSETYFLKPDPYVTLTEPSTTERVITVNAYADEDGSFYEKSGRGFTADRRVKPEFAAPGVNVPTILGRRTGSSMAAAMAAGATAQMMQWAVVEKNYPLATGRELKYYLALGAVREENIEYPSREWGLGKINVQRTFQELAGLF